MDIETVKQDIYKYLFRAESNGANRYQMMQAYTTVEKLFNIDETLALNTVLYWIANRDTIAQEMPSLLPEKQGQEQ